MKKLIDAFFQAYLIKRDLEEILSFLTDDVISIGTGEHEIAMEKPEFRELLKQEFAQLPDPFQYEMLNYKEKKETETVRSVYAKFKITLLRDSGNMQMQARFTGTCIKKGDSWKLSSMHMSSGSTEQEEGSFFPLLYGTAVPEKLSGTSEMELMKLVMKTLPGGIMGGYLEKGFPLYTINDKMLEILGYSYEELLAVSGEKMLNVIYEADRDRVEKEIYRQLAEGEQYETEYRLITKDGSLLWINDIGRKIVVDSGREAMISIMSDITKRMEQELAERNTQYKMEVLAYTDALTGIGNRTAFNEQLREYAAYETLGCVVADVNNLKLCNDRYGHKEGDQIIIDAADCICEAFHEKGNSYRIGGDEFCILIPDAEKTEILRTLEKLKTLIADKNKHRVMPLSIAFGYALREGASESVETLFNRSDEMMYDVKHRMKNEFPVYREEKISNYLNVLKILRKSTDDYLFLWDIGRDEFWYFEEIDAEYAVHNGEKPTASSKELDQIIYPADREMLYQDLNQIAKGEKADHDLNYRWVNKKGEPVWINCRGQVISDDKGKPFCMIGRVSEQKLRYLYNPLTKLFNKEKMFQDFEQETIANGYLALTSIDNLNNINLEYGRNYGDQVIKKCAELLEQSEEIPYLWHAESNCFALYLTVQSEEEVKNIYERLSSRLMNFCTISMGAVPDDEAIFEYIQDLYTCADLTLEKAKAAGKKKLMFFSKKDLEERKKSVQLFEELRRNVLDGCKGFHLHYQPLIRSGNYQIYGAEALLRYHSEVLGELGPDEFIPLLEQPKLLNEVGSWVLEQALLQCRRWRNWLPDFHININFSAVQLNEENIVDRVLGILEKTQMPGNALTIELTESIQLHGIQYLNKIFKIWRAAGIELSIDDFGTGYASLGYLKELNVDEIKIARLFVERIEEDTYNYRLLSNMIDFAKNNQIRICCEGVERIEELAVLEGLAPNLLQGYLFAKPCDAATFEHSFLDRSMEEYQKYLNSVQELYQYKSRGNILHFDAKDILRETQVGLWIIRMDPEKAYYELNADETMEFVMGVDKKYTPTECYEFWFSRIKTEYLDYVKKNIQYVIETGKMIQLQYPWQHPKLGEVIVRCSGKRVEDSDGMITLKGYHRIVSTLEEKVKAGEKDSDGKESR